MSHDLFSFKVNKADAYLDGGGMSVRVWYPRSPEKINYRLLENLQYGIATLEKLKKEGYSEIADNDHPIRPPSAGSLYVTKDGKLIFYEMGKSKIEPIKKLEPKHYNQDKRMIGFIAGNKKIADDVMDMLLNLK